MIESRGVRPLIIAAAALGAAHGTPAFAQEEEGFQPMFERGESFGRFFARTRGFCPLNVVGMPDQEGHITHDPELPLLEAEGRPEREIIAYLMGRGYGCRSEREIIDDQVERGLTIEIRRGNMNVVE